MPGRLIMTRKPKRDPYKPHSNIHYWYSYRCSTHDAIPSYHAASRRCRCWCVCLSIVMYPSRCFTGLLEAINACANNPLYRYYIRSALMNSWANGGSNSKGFCTWRNDVRSVHWETFAVGEGRNYVPCFFKRFFRSNISFNPNILSSFLLSDHILFLFLPIVPSLFLSLFHFSSTLSFSCTGVQFWVAATYLLSCNCVSTERTLPVFRILK